MNFVANTKKILQRRSYDFLSQKYSILLITLIIFSLLTTVIQFGEVWLRWSKEKYEAAFNPFSDNVIKKPLQDKLCQHVPIDVVYTWVNGSDPLLQGQLREYEEKLREEKPAECPYAVCLPSHIVTARFPNEGPEKEYDIALTNLWNREKVQNPPEKNHSLNRTIIYFSDPEEAGDVVQQTVMVKKANVTLFQAHWTSEKFAPASYPVKNTLIITGIPSVVMHNIENDIRALFQKYVGDNIVNVWMYPNNGTSVIELGTEKAATAMMELSRGTLYLEEMKITVSNAYIIMELPFANTESLAPSRFEDKEELRYSLRSLEKFAPWVRHVYVVTNGQIPHWLNLDNPRLTVVPHNKIFPDMSHLPTFSSPAIETHLHRIPGLSDKFLYFNDDVMLGKEVWPEDFITYSKGQKVYFSWSVPDCSVLCPWSYINDGSCDVACNTSDCFYDGGDCDLGNGDAGSNGGVEMYDENNQSMDAFNDEGFDSQLNFEDNNDNPFKHINFFDDMDRKEGSRQEDSVAQLFNTSERETLTENTLSAINSVEENNEYTEPVASSSTAPHVSVSRQTNYKFHYNYDRTLSHDSVTKFPVGSNETVGPLTPDNSVSLGTGRFSSVPDVNKEVDVNDYNSTRTFATKYVGKFVSSINRKPNSIDDNFQLADETRHVKNADGSSHKTRRQSSLRKIVKDMIKQNRKNYGKYHRWDRTNVEKIIPNASKPRKAFLERVNGMSVTEFPHEKQNYNQLRVYRTPYGISRKVLRDSFAGSLLYVNRLYSKEFGFEVRKVPAHMPHLIDKKIMEDLQRRFQDEWLLTSSHKIRRANDMQYAFSYFYFLMSEKKSRSASEIFDIFDTDQSGTLSDREIRTLLARLYELPIGFHRVTAFTNKVINCSRTVPHVVYEREAFTPMYERYQDSRLPIVSRPLVVNCGPLAKLLTSKFGSVKRYKYEIVKDKHQDVTFKMINSNITHVVSVLDEIRKEPKKFICLNDNLDPAVEKVNDVIRAVLQDFYEALFPAPSSFELPPEYRNRFLHVSELEAWRASRNIARVFVYLCLALLLSFSLVSFLLIERQVRCRRKASNGNLARQYADVGV
ncbi:N-acetylglucosamine-1-phosphotransferase subunits alpha/beta-like isoform X1 [Schistocerca piceifrons]|uniref:N-acetylglucosamine-1-phosphotransferase subunits alpha/beta-like isoform X1 n=3 Tax=Schistocerca piceifrons TaxID=274613 RepID=UPI001F5FEA52|nr:N-acetylglucosamine-1-phosphotransferase subunits alpha/beta-like isoform X1 [Schistocerca piceifrons]